MTQSPHPSEEQLGRFSKGLLDDTDFDRVAAHVETCDPCARWLEQHAASLRLSNSSAGVGAGPGTVIGPYKLLQSLGEGGMGVVFMAEQQSPIRRIVALKVIKPGMDSQQVIARFEAERQALAMMDHHNIARVLDAGTTEVGRPYFVMELVKGIPITAHCDQNRLTPQERLELFVPVCNAVQHAHQKGIIHRDLKPSNVLVTLYDGRPVPKVIDFGIAKAIDQRLTERTMFTQLGQILGTWEYMSPEQAELNQLDIDTRSDIYSLGVLLYELLTGSPPITRHQLHQAGYEQMLRTIREFEPPTPSARLSDSKDSLPQVSVARRLPPAQLSRYVKGDLDWIVMKALEKDRGRRYETANELALDLQRFLADKPVTACPPSLSYSLKKLARRHRTSFAFALVVTSMLVSFSLVSTALTVWALRENQNRVEREREAIAAAAAAQVATQQALAAVTQAERSRDLARRHAYAADMYVAGEALHRDHDIRRVRSILERHRPVPGTTDLRGWEWRYLWQFCQLEANGTMASIGEAIRSVSVSPNDAYFAVAVDAGRLELWNVQTRRRLAVRDNLQKRFRAPAFSPDGQLLVAVAPSGLVELLSVPTLTTRQKFSTDEPFVSAVAFSPDGELLAASCGTGTLVWRVRDGARIVRIPGKLGWLAAGDTCFSPDGQMLYIGDTVPGSLRAYEVEALLSTDGATPPSPAFSYSQKVTSIAVSSDSRILAYSVEGAPYDIFLVDAKRGDLIGTLGGHHEWIMDLLFDCSGKLWSVGNDNTVRVWDVPNRHQCRSLRVLAHTFQLAQIPSQRCLLSAGDDGMIYRWNLDQQELTRSQSAYQTIAHSLGGDRIGAPLITPDETGILYLSEVDDATGKLSSFVNHVALARTADVRETRRWDKSGAKDFYGSLSWANENQVVAGSLSGALRVFHGDTGRLLLELEAHPAHTEEQRYTWLAQLSVFASHWLPRHQLIATRKALAPPDSDIPATTEMKFWSTTDWQRSRALVPPNYDKPFDLLWFSPDESMCVLYSKLNNELTCWSTTTGNLIHSRNDVQGVAFSIKPHIMAAISIGAGTVTLFDTRDFSATMAFQAHSHQITDIAWLPNENRLITGSKDQEMVRLWDVEINRMLLNLPGEGHRPVLSVSARGNIIVARDTTGIVNVWRAPTWEDIARTEQRGNL